MYALLLHVLFSLYWIEWFEKSLVLQTYMLHCNTVILLWHEPCRCKLKQPSFFVLLRKWEANGRRVYWLCLRHRSKWIQPEAVGRLDTKSSWSRVDVLYQVMTLYDVTMYFLFGQILESLCFSWIRAARLVQRGDCFFGLLDKIFLHCISFIKLERFSRWTWCSRS